MQQFQENDFLEQLEHIVLYRTAIYCLLLILLIVNLVENFVEFRKLNFSVRLS